MAQRLFTGQYGPLSQVDTRPIVQAGQAWGQAIQGTLENVGKAIEKNRLNKANEELRPKIIARAMRSGMSREDAEVAADSIRKDSKNYGVELLQVMNRELDREQQQKNMKLQQESLRLQNEFFKATKDIKKKNMELANTGKEAANILAGLNIKDAKTQQKINEVINRIYTPEQRAMDERTKASQNLEQIKQQTESLKQSIAQSKRLFEPQLRAAEAGAIQAELEAQKATELTPLAINFETGRLLEGKAEQDIAKTMREMQGGVAGQAALRAEDQKQERELKQLQANQVRLMNKGELARQDAATLKKNIENDVYMVKFDANGVPKVTGDLAGASPEYRQRVMYEAEKLRDERTLRKLTVEGKQASIDYTQAMKRYQEKLINSAKDKTSTEFERNMDKALKLGWIDPDSAKEYYLQRIDTISGAPKDATEETKLEYAGKMPMASGLNLRQLSNTYTLAQSGGSDQATYEEKLDKTKYRQNLRSGMSDKKARADATQGILHYKYMGKDTSGNDKVLDGEIKITPDLMGKINAFKAREKSFLEGGGTTRTPTLGLGDITPQGIQNALVE